MRAMFRLRYRDAACRDSYHQSQKRSLQRHFVDLRVILLYHVEEGVWQGAISAQPFASTKWSDVFTDLSDRIACRFARTEVRERFRRYLYGLFTTVERKNGWQLAEAIGDADPQGVQRLVRTAYWDADAVRNDLRNYVLTQLGDDANGVLIVDETGFLKKGNKSCGVARQYTGTAGDIVNAHATQRVPGRFPRLCFPEGSRVHRSCPLPSTGMDDGPRPSRRSGDPDRHPLRHQGHPCRANAGRAFDAGAPARWVVADSGYGRSHRRRRTRVGCGVVLRCHQCCPEGRNLWDAVNAAWAPTRSPSSILL